MIELKSVSSSPLGLAGSWLLLLGGMTEVRSFSADGGLRAGAALTAGFAAAGAGGAAEGVRAPGLVGASFGNTVTRVASSSPSSDDLTSEVLIAAVLTPDLTVEAYAQAPDSERTAFGFDDRPPETVMPVAPEKTGSLLPGFKRAANVAPYRTF